MTEKKPFYITTPIYYPSAKLHIGHAYCTTIADSIARFHRLIGEDVFFLTGSDEHGQKIQQKAEEAGVTPIEYVDKIVAGFQNLWKRLNISNDDFIRTTQKRHERVVQEIFNRIYAKGDIYKGSYKGLYCTPCESYWTEHQLDENGCCPDCHRPVQEVSEEAYFFKMSKYQDKLMKHIEQHPEFIQPESRRNEMVNNFLKPGLQDLCVSRTSFKWGIPVDFDPKHVVYVWVDALSNYITGLGYDVDGKSDEKFYKYWPADLHLIGKDILRFHTIYWPIMLMALGLPLPKQVFGHPWLLQSDGKMSKSKGNVMYADDMVNIFGVDAVRFFVLHEMPFENDGVISWELMVERLNSELANTLGNLVNRTISMSNKYFGGIVTNTNVTEPVDEDLKKVVMDCRYKVAECMDKLKVADAITEIFALFKRCNKYIDETMPWALAKEEDKKDRLNTVLYNLVESIVIGATLLEPYMPETTEKIMAQLNTEKRKVTELGKFGLYKSGTKVTEQPEILFARLDVKEVMAKVAEFAPVEKESMYEQAKKQKEEKENSAETKKIKIAEAKVQALKANPDVVDKQEISIEEFQKMQLMIGEIVSCEEVPNSRKLLCSQVSFGKNNVKQIVSGIKGTYSAEDMVGKKVVAIVNLKPCKLAGVVSEGMLLCAEDPEGNLSLLTTEKDFPGGCFIS